MKIKILAYLSAPSLLQWYGVPNPIICTGNFTKEISEKEKTCLKCRDTITCKGIVLVIRKIHKGKNFTCDGNLPSISFHFFKKLKKSGWKIDKEASSKYGFPSNDQEKRLKEDVLQHQDEAKRCLKAQKNLKKMFKKMKKKIEKKVTDH